MVLEARSSELMTNRILMFNDDCMDHLSETGDKRLLLSYLNLKSLTKMSLKEEFVHTKFTYFCGGSSCTGLVDTSFNCG